MAGIYIHIPFCKQKCNYCNFYSLANQKNFDLLVDAIQSEILQRTDYLGNTKIETIYFGGGTPSLLDINQIARILKTIFDNFSVSENAEITLEANPDDLTLEKSKGLFDLGINRLSIGVQSFNNQDLVFLNRSHHAKQVFDCIENVKKVGFRNLSIDLIYGIQTLSHDTWIENLTHAHKLEINHISAYWLTIEEKTPLELQIRKGKITPIEETIAVEQFEILTKLLPNFGYQHYEISNFCLPNCYSKHNTAYWQQKPYLGVGPSAHSYNGISRSANVSNKNEYIHSVTNGKVLAETEFLTPTMKLNEYIMTSLRTSWGCDLAYFRNQFGDLKFEKLMKNANIYLANNNLFINSNHLIVSPKSRLFTDGIAADLFES